MHKFTALCTTLFIVCLFFACTTEVLATQTEANKELLKEIVKSAREGKALGCKHGIGTHKDHILCDLGAPIVTERNELIYSNMHFGLYGTGKVSSILLQDFRFNSLTDADVVHSLIKDIIGVYKDIIECKLGDHILIFRIKNQHVFEIRLK